MTDTKAMPVGVRVKDLQWVSEAQYLVARLPELRVHYALEAWEDRATLTGTWFGRRDFPTIDEAKAAAQADFASRILSTIEAGPGGAEPSEAQVLDAWHAGRMAIGKPWVTPTEVDLVGIRAALKAAALSPIGGEAEPVAACEGENHSHPAHEWHTACLICGVFRGTDLKTIPAKAEGHDNA